MPVGFIGLGSLGKAIASRLVSEGVDLVVWNRTLSKADGLKAERAPSPRAVSEKCDVILVCLFDSNGVATVLDGPEGVLKADSNGKIVVDLTTNHFDPVVKFHDDVCVRGGSYLESPVLGSVVPASRGALTVLVSGKKAAYEKAVPVLQKIGSTVFFLETPGLATKISMAKELFGVAMSRGLAAEDFSAVFKTIKGA